MKIQKELVEDVQPLTPMQSGMLFHYIDNPNSKVYLEQMCIELNGNIHKDYFEKAWEIVIDNNEVLRAVYRWDKLENPVQIILKKIELPVRIFTDDSSLEDIKKEDINEGIDLLTAPFRIKLIHRKENQYVMLITYHHILFDGWSTAILLKEFFTNYEYRICKKEKNNVQKKPYREYLKWLSQQSREKQEQWWRKNLSGLESTTRFCLEQKENAKSEQSYQSIVKTIDSTEFKKLRKYCSDKRISLSTVIYSVWGFLLSRYNNTEDVVLGITVSGRTSEIQHMEEMVGLFINTVPLKLKVDAEYTWNEYVTQVAKQLNELMEYEHSSLSNIQHWSGFSNQNKLFDSVVVVENYPIDKERMNQSNGLQIVSATVTEQTNYPMAFGVMLAEDMKLNFIYDSALLYEEYVQNAASHILKILENVVESEDCKIGEVSIVTEQEDYLIREEYNHTATCYPKSETVVELFEEQVEKNPEQIAVTYGNESLTYQELNTRANQLASVLREKGIEADDVVGIMEERSLSLMVGIFAILKAGGAYLPIDSKIPEERIQYMLEDSKATILLTKAKDRNFNCEILDIDEGVLQGSDSCKSEDTISPQNAAYVIYTSGSTGKPKGVVVEHKSLVNFLFCMYRYFGEQVGSNDNCLSLTNIAFDVSVCEMFLPLVFGANLVLLDTSDIFDVNYLSDVILTKNITFTYIPPSLLTEVYEQLNEKRCGKSVALNKMLVGVESIQDATLYQYTLLNKEIQILNGYGPTEATICATFYSYVPGKARNRNVPIGRPLDNNRVYILDHRGNIQPVGVPGELYIAGDGLARGYLNNEELTAQKFISNPFEQNQQRMYKTGDLGRWLPNGVIEFLGRVDNQIKLRGFRIELDEIKKQILQYPHVLDDVVITREDAIRGEKYICAYIKSEKELDVVEIRNHLAKKLPDYMIPTFFIPIDRIPLTSNGKVDKKALPEPDVRFNLESEYVVPQNELQKKLVDIWQKVLRVERIGIQDDFFALGGNSLKSIQLVGKIHKELDVKIQVSEIFNHRTIQSLEKYINTLQKYQFKIIEKIPQKEYYCVSSAQKRMYLLQQMDKNSTAYNISSVYKIVGDADINKIEQVFTQLMMRHESLRTTFAMYHGDLIQKVENSIEFHLVTRVIEKPIEECIHQFVKPFDLENGPLFRVEVIKNQEGSYLLIDMHHIISDGISMSILIRDFKDLYCGKLLKQQNIQYKDFAAWQKDFLDSNEMKESEQYWLNMYRDDIPVLNLPTDFNRNAMISFTGDSIKFTIDEKMTKDLHTLAIQNNTTLHMILMSAYYILLSKYSGQDDIVIGIPVAGRIHEDTQEMVGMFVNTLAMRNYPTSTKSYLTFLQEVKERTLQAYAYQSYQFEDLVDQLDVKRDLSRNPLVDVLFNMVDADQIQKIQLEDIELELVPMPNTGVKFDLSLNVTEKESTLDVELEYCSQLFKKQTISQLGQHYIKILSEVITSQEKMLCDINLLSDKERNLLLHEFNRTQVAFDHQKTLQELFEEQVSRTPDKTALVFEGQKLTYRELNRKANHLAVQLQKNGVKADCIVGLLQERSLNLIIGILGILKAGGGYMPIDPKYSKERIQYMLSDSESSLLLVSNETAEIFDFDGTVLNIDQVMQEIPESIGIVDTSSYSLNNIAYIIYTSGSTGLPKGVLVEQKGVVSLKAYFDDIVPISQDDTMIQFASSSFDVSVSEIFFAILSGATLHVLSKRIIGSYELFSNYLNEQEITVAFLPPTYLANLNPDDIKTLRVLLTAGSVISKELVTIWGEKVQYVNAYGPTETTIYSTVWKDKREDLREFNSVPIGKPVGNTRIYILDKQNNLQPIGVVGELCIGGIGLARGYLRRPELTKEKFVELPVIEGKPLYRTGDLARWLPDGNIEFFGRIDDQVKIRGFRVEPGEIESNILKHDMVNETVVQARTDSEGNQYLCAYFTAQQQLLVGELRRYLSKTLPDYMIPSYFVQLQEMPLTPSKKIDKKRLPEPTQVIDFSMQYIAPDNEIEKALVEIWKKVLGLTRIGVTDNFFDLGGNSLKATSMISTIKKEMHVDVPLREVFLAPSIKELAEYINQSKNSLYEAIKPVSIKDYYEVSAAQRRLYAIQQFDIESTSYNMPIILRFDGQVDVERLEGSLQKLVDRHEAFRTSFEVIEEKLVQKVQPSIEFHMEYARIQENELETVVKEYVKPFDLSLAPLMRARLVQLAQYQYVLLLDLHHIISDGISLSVLTKEFSKLYGGEELSPLELQYKDYSEWQNGSIYREAIKKQREYWLERFSDELPVLNLPTNYKRPQLGNCPEHRIGFEIDEAMTARLREIAIETGSTLYMVLLSAINVLLYKYSGQTDIIVGSPIAGRNRADLQQIIGMFVNTLAMRNHPEGKKTFSEFLREVKENSLEAFENQDYQFEELVNELNLERDFTRNPLFDVMFVLQNTDKVDMNLGSVRINERRVENRTAKLDLNFMAVEDTKKITMEIQYCSELFYRETIERMTGHLQNILQAISININCTLGEIEILQEEEKKQILEEYNDTKEVFDQQKLIHQLFEEQVRKNPDHIAAVGESTSISYQELNEKANQIAHLLVKRGAKPGSIVAIFVERSLDMISAVLAVLKAGGVYLPFDMNVPENRMIGILKDLDCQHMLCHMETLERAMKIKFSDKEDIALYCIDQSVERNDYPYLFTLREIEEQPLNNLALDVSSESLAYIIYTSGSTGIPKGVAVQHYPAINLIQWVNKTFHVTELDKLMFITSIGFDLSVYDMFGILAAGGKIRVVSRQELQNPNKLMEILCKEEITIWDSAPAGLKQLTNLFDEYKEEARYSKLRLVMLSGDWIPVKLPDKVRETFLHAQVISLGGATEATIWSNYYPIREVGEDWVSIPYGKPIQNAKYYILNENAQPCPIGVEGDLYIGGECLAMGYMNNPELTKERFIENPFVPGERIYATGDRARWFSDGNMEFMGRKDNQVKIRGYRVELGEIESQLLKYPDVREALVLAKEDKTNEKYLCAYVVGNREFTTEELSEFLGRHLPGYMIPPFFISLESFPLTSNGKINRKALPSPNFDIGEEIFEEPVGEIEIKLAAIWKALIAIEQLGRNHNFFEIGGHSLTATILYSKVRSEFGVELPIREIFALPTIKEQANYISKAKQSSYQAIKPTEKKPYYAVSSAQKRMYLLCQMDGEKTVYNIPSIYKMDGDVDRRKLEEAFQKLITRHEALRTSFEMVNGEVVQRIHDYVDWQFQYEEWKDIDTLDETQIENFRKEFVKPFEFGMESLIRVSLVKVHEKQYLLGIDMHHIISDGISTEIIMSEIIKLYEGKELEPLKIQYKDYAVWQNEKVSSGMLSEQATYWIHQFEDEIPVLELPSDDSRPAIQSFVGDTRSFKLDKTLTEALYDMAEHEGVTLYMVLLAAYNILLFRYTNQKDIVVGTPTAGRKQIELQSIVGNFVNTLPIRNYPSGEKTVTEFIAEVKETVLNGFENQEYQFEDLVDTLNIKRDISRNPLFDTMLVLQNMKETKQAGFSFGDIQVCDCPVTSQTSKLDVSFIFFETEDGLECFIEYSSKLFQRDRIDRMASHFKTILCDMVRHPSEKIAEIEMITESEKLQITHTFNQTDADYPKGKTVPELFEEQVEQRPEQIAVIYEDKKLTYREFNQLVNRVANWLREQYDIRPDDLIGIMLPRSEQMMIAIMGIIKSGAAYVPIDPSYPEERINYILEDSECKIVISNQTEGIYVAIQDILEQSSNYSNPEKILNDSNVAYVIYTSGSTGNPKGVLIEHRAMINRIHWMHNSYPIDEQDTILQKTTYTFDVSVWELFWWALYGAKVCLLSQGGEKDPDQIVSAIENNNITTMHFVPSMFHIFLEYVKEQQCIKQLKTLQYIFCSGESLLREHVEKFNELLKQNGTKLINLYGPTEAAIDVTYYNCQETNDVVPIGKPISNIKLYIMNEDNKMVPIGIPGELCIAGVGLARGYLNKPELTKKSFVENPLVPGTRMYRTGDIARWMPDGNIEFIGRKDHQVKIRGFRIELEEINAHTRRIEGVEDVVTIDFEDANGEKQLCSYIVSKENLDPSIIRRELSNHLVNYMIPQYFVHLEQIPLTNNGKVNRKALVKPGNMLSKAYVAPRNETEEKVSQCVTQILNYETISVLDNLFEIGMHSLRAIQLILKIQKEFGVKLELTDIFLHSTIEEIAEYLKGQDMQLQIEPIERVEEKEYYEVSSAQKRLFFLHSLLQDNMAYNMPTVMVLEGAVNRQKVQEAFEVLISRHESLRTTFTMLDGHLVQKIQDKVPFELEYRESKENIDAIIKSFLRPFDLATAPLLRASLVKIEENIYLFLCDMHHIISDGVSLAVLIEEFGMLYRGEELPQLRARYIDYTQWMQNYAKSEEAMATESYWLSQFEEEIPILNLPLDYQRPLVQSFEGDTVSFNISKDDTLSLNRLAAEEGASLFMVLLSICNVVFSKICSQEDILIGTPVAGRIHPEIERTIGVFLNTLVLKNRVDPNKNFVEFLGEVKTSTLKALENQSYPFEELVEKANIVRQTDRNPMFDVMFALNNMQTSKLELPNIDVKPYEFADESTKLDIKITAYEVEDEICMNFRYNTSLFKKETICNYMKYFQTVMTEVLKDSNRQIATIELLEEDKQRSILEQFNSDLQQNNLTVIQEKLEEALNQYGDKCAVRCGSEELSYRQLLRQSNYVANYLKEHHVEKGSYVMAALTKKSDLIIAMLGIMKAGCVFVPYDENQTGQRIEHVIETLQIRYTIADALTNHTLSHDKGSKLTEGLVLFDELFEEREDWFSVSPKIEFDKDDILYAYFTSGSTGKPKIIAGRNESLLHFIQWEIRQFNLPEGIRVSQLTKPTFDPFLRDIFVPLFAGGTICIPENTSVILDSIQLAKWIESESIQLVHIVPSIFRVISNVNLLKDSFRELQYVLLAGEKLYPSYLKNWYEKIGERVQLVNLYGPTETTLAKFFHVIQLSDLSRSNTVPVGRPILGASAIILNKDGNICGEGLPGELYIRTPYRSLGYIQNDELNAKHFIQNPFSQNDNDIIYRTGDLARYTKDGVVEILGRTDRQIKINGQRVELEEIEGYVLSIPYVKECVMIKKDRGTNDSFICAFYTVKESIQEGNIKNDLRKIMPEYMIPTCVMKLDHMPYTSHGKYDMKSLLHMDVSIQKSNVSSVHTVMEEKLASIWADILKIEMKHVNVEDNFFDAGGNSFILMQFHSRVCKELQLEDVTIVTLFQYSSIRQFAEYLENRDLEGQTNQETQVDEEIEDEETDNLTSTFQLLRKLKED